MRSKGDPLLDMPKIEPFGYIIPMLCEAGVAKKDGPLDWPDFESWINATGTKVSRWELTTLKRLSLTYFSSIRKYSNSDENSPVTLQGAKAKQNVDDKLKNTLRTIGAKQ